MSSSPGGAVRLSPRRMLAATALTAVLGLGVSAATPTGPASAASVAPVAASSSSALGADSVGASAWGRISSRSYFINESDILVLSAHRISAQGLAVLVCTQHGSGRACVLPVAAALSVPGRADPTQCRDGYTVVIPLIYKSHCGR